MFVYYTSFPSPCHYKLFSPLFFTSLRHSLQIHLCHILYFVSFHHINGKCFSLTPPPRYGIVSTCKACLLYTLR